MKYLWYIGVTICLFLLAGCMNKDVHYYKMYPKALMVAINQCPKTSPPQVSCEELVAIAGKLNTLAYQLQIDPQEFGKKILRLQQEIAEQEKLVVMRADLKPILEKNKEQLEQYLAIVRWLESPEG